MWKKRRFSEFISSPFSMKLGIVHIQPTGQCPPWGFFDLSSGSKVTKIISRTGRLISNSRVRTSIHTLNKICAKFGGPIFKDVETAASPPTKQDFRVYHCRFCVMRAILEKCIHPNKNFQEIDNFCCLNCQFCETGLNMAHSLG